MLKRAMLLIVAALLATGCGRPAPRRAGMQIPTDQGIWKLTGVDRAAFQQDGWIVYIYDTEVSDIGHAPRLEKFILEIANTDDTRPLYIVPGEIWVTAPDNHPIQLGPEKGHVLAKDQSWSVLFDEGVRSPDMAYPFSITITVFRGANSTQPQSVFIPLY